MDQSLALLSDRRIPLSAAIALLAIALAIVPNASPAAPNDISVDFSWAPASPTPGQIVTFTAATGGADIKKYEWDLNGDGSIDKNGASATWSYPAPGSVNVVLRVKAKGAQRGEVAHSVPVQVPDGGVTPIPPVASFTIAPTTPVVNQPVLFTSASSDLDGALTEQVWDLNGDGSYDNGGGVTALRTFAEPGEYVIGLRVTDDAGLVAFSSQTVTVLSAARQQCHDAEVGTAAAESVPGRADRGPDHEARDAGTAPACERARRHAGLGPLHRPQLPVQPTGADDPDGRKVAGRGKRPRAPSRAAAAPWSPRPCLRHQARVVWQVHEVPLPRRQGACSHRQLPLSGFAGPG